MYTVILDGTEYIHDPLHETGDRMLLNGVLTKKANCADSFTFTMPPNHACYDDLVLMKSEIRVYKDGVCLFSGRPLTEEMDFEKYKEVVCESDIAMLNDTVIRPYVFTGSVREYVEMIVSKHNEAVYDDDPGKTFSVGSVTVTDPNNYIRRSTSDYVTAMKELSEKTVGHMGGYLRVVPGTRVIDYLEDSTDGTDQKVEIGKNIVDFQRSISAEAVATALIPLGATDDETGERVTIESVNSGRDYIVDSTAAAERGLIFATLTWDDITLPQNLLTKAQAALVDLKRIVPRIQLTAVDLKDAGADVEALGFFEYVTVEDTAHGLSGQYLITERQYNLSYPERDKVTFGGEEPTISGAANRAQRDVTSLAGNVSSEIMEIVEKQTDLLSGAEGGNVVIHTDADGKPYEILIMDTADVSTAVKVLRINMNGIGFSTNGISGPYSTAWTIDGVFNANYITTGGLCGWKIGTGLLSSQTSVTSGTAGWQYQCGLASNAADPGNIAIYVAKRWYDGGDPAAAGSYSSWEYPFCVTYKGTLQATGALIQGKISASEIVGSSFEATGGHMEYTITQADITRMGQIALGVITPTSEDYEKYDINRDGVIDVYDISEANYILDHGGEATIEWIVRIDPEDKDHAMTVTKKRVCSGIEDTTTVFSVSQTQTRANIISADNVLRAGSAAAARAELRETGLQMFSAGGVQKASLYADITTLTPTYLSNSYCDSTAVGRVYIMHRGSFGMLVVNLEINSTALPSNSIWVQIGVFPGMKSIPYNIYANIEAQNGSGTILFELDTDGKIWIYNESGAAASGWHRAVLPVMFEI